MKTAALILAAALALPAAELALPSAAGAEEWKDYTPRKTAIRVTMLEVDPNHIDDYVTGLKKTWVPCMEALKRHGVIDDYGVTTNINYEASPNVMIWSHLTGLAAMEPNKERDQAIDKECAAGEDGKLLQNYTSWRKFLSSDTFQELDFTK